MVAEMTVNQVMRQGAGPSAECSTAHERLYGESPRREITMCPEVNLDGVNEMGRAWIHQLKVVVNALIDEYNVWRSEQALYNMRDKRADLAKRRKLDLASRSDIVEGAHVLFEDQEREVVRLYRNPSGDPTMVLLDDGSSVQVSAVTLIRDISREPTMVSASRLSTYDDGTFVFFRMKSDQPDEPEWMIHVGKVVNYNEAKETYKLHAYRVVLGRKLATGSIIWE
ncbi:hypothetical protein FOZ63_012417 [Perkinsus olseni]|uniref:Uncharacterized protein n=1 Tax=Perkinsus olseni TaxID=32597 RepID=A0A7J6U147_PEROL|nr:hypothetical protein FOZ63_012417 [Perkinsus olseni]